jgi:hypothetical protein
MPSDERGQKPVVPGCGGSVESRRCHSRPGRITSVQISQQCNRTGPPHSEERVWLAKEYGSFHTAWRSLQGIETVHTIRKGLVGKRGCGGPRSSLSSGCSAPLFNGFDNSQLSSDPNRFSEDFATKPKSIPCAVGSSWLMKSILDGKGHTGYRGACTRKAKTRACESGNERKGETERGVDLTHGAHWSGRVRRPDVNHTVFGA